MEEFRPCLAERLALTLINRRQIESKHFREREGGAVEFTERGRKEVIQAWQRRKQTEVKHALFKQNIRFGAGFQHSSQVIGPAKSAAISPTIFPSFQNNVYPDRVTTFLRPTELGNGGCAKWQEPVRITASECRNRFLNASWEKPNGRRSGVVC